MLWKCSVLAHKHMSSEWTCRRTTETAAPTSWFERTPVRSGGCGPVRSGDGEPARDEGSRIRLIQTGVGWCLGCVSVLDAVRIGTSSILHLSADSLSSATPPLPRPFPARSDSQRNRCFETVLCFGSVEPIRNAFVNLDCYERTWFHNLCDLVEHIIKQY